MTEPQPFDFGKPARLTAEVEHRVSSWLRAAAALTVKKTARHIPFALEMSFHGLEVLRPADALARLSDASVGYTASVNADPANALAALPRQLSLAIVAGMLGDMPGELPADRELSVVELDLCQFFVEDAIVTSLQETWPAAETIPIKVRKREVHPKWTRVFPPNDTVIACALSVKAEFGEGEWHWIVPQKYLLEQLALGLPGAEKTKPSAGASDPVKLRQLMEEVPVELTVVLGTVELSLAELGKMDVGDLVLLNHRVQRSRCRPCWRARSCMPWLAGPCRFAASL